MVNSDLARDERAEILNTVTQIKPFFTPKINSLLLKNCRTGSEIEVVKVRKQEVKRPLVVKG